MKNWLQDPKRRDTGKKNDLLTSFMSSYHKQKLSEKNTTSIDKMPT